MSKIVFMGTPDFSVPILRQLVTDGYDVVGVVTQPDRPKGRKKIMTPPPVKVEAQRHQIPVLQPSKLNVNEEEINQILCLQPDLIVTAAYGQLLPKKVLDAPAYGCINVHASLLPELRGGAPIHYALLEGKKETGITIMYMVEKLDAGAILAQSKIVIEETDHVGSLHEKLSEIGAKLLSETIPKLLHNEIEPVEQNDDEASFASNIKREQERINWSKKGEEIYNHIRGLHPWPVAYTTYNGNVMKIWWGEKVIHRYDGEPGTIVELQDNGFIVKTGNDTAIKITELQPAGKKRMTGEEFLRGSGAHVAKNEKLGDDNE